MNYPYQPQWELPGPFGKLLIDVSNYTQAPIGLLTSVALVAASIAVQGSVKVQMKKGFFSCCSLFVLNISESGERKTLAQKLFLKPFADIERASNAEVSKQWQCYEIEHKVWNQRSKLLAKKLKQHVGTNQEDEAFDATYREHLQNEPKPPKAIKLLYSDATKEALLAGMKESGGSAALVFDEFEQFTKGPMQRSLHLLNTLWSGEGERVDRKISESFVVGESNLTMLLQAQPEVFRAYLSKHKTAARSNGFLARVLMGAPISTKGFRVTEPNLDPPESLNWFTERCQALVGRNEKQILRFSDDAQYEWNQYCHWCETSMAPGTQLASISDFLSKSPEHVARIAGILHAINGDPGEEISLVSLNAAISMVNWHMNQFIMLVATVNQETEYQQDLRELDNWIRDHCYRLNSPIESSYILQYGPKRLRNKVKLNPLLDNLHFIGCLRIFFIGKKKVVSHNFR